jgi:hypothetical protein
LHQQIQFVPLYAKLIRDENVRLTEHRSLITYRSERCQRCNRYAQHYNRSRDVVIRVHGAAGSTMEMHEHPGDFMEPERIIEEKWLETIEA